MIVLRALHNVKITCVICRYTDLVWKRSPSLVPVPHDMCPAVQVTYCAQLNAASDKAVLCQQQEAQDSCRRSCDMCYAKADSSSLVWYNQHRHTMTPSSAPYPTPTHNQSQASSEGGTGGSKHARLNAYTRLESQSGVLRSPITHEMNANSAGQMNNSCGHLTADIAPGGDLAQDQNVSMHAGLRSQDSWNKHLSNPFCKSVLFLCALLLALTIWLARGKIRRKRSLQYLHA